jgi:hypothetical protein
MDDNRSIANKELGDAFDGNMVAINSGGSQINENLPQQEEQSENASGVVNYNFNVNVTVNPRGSSSSTRMQENTTNQIVNNALASGTTNPEELKKNSSTDSKPSGESELIFLESGNDKIKLMEQAVNSGPIQPVLDIRRIDTFLPSVPSDYSYSESQVKSKNIDLKRSYDVLHDLTQGALSNYAEMSYLPKTVLNTEFDARLKENTINFYESENIKIEQNQTLYDSAAEISENNERLVQTRERERDEALMVMAKNQTGKPTDGQKEFVEMRDGQIIAGNSIPAATTLNTSGARDFNNITTRSTTIESFVDKMNSPPNWRTVLG